MRAELNLFQTHKFPRTRYQGSKYKLQAWIKNNLEKLDFETALDAFSGTSSIAYIMKEMDKTVYCNDILAFNYHIAQALIENNSQQITKDEFEDIIKKKEGYQYASFIQDTFEDIYFLDEENRWLDIVIQNINKLQNKNNKAYNKDIFTLDISVDLVYFDTPYIPQKGTLTHYRDFYHFLDGLIDYENWHKQIDYTSKHKKLKSTYNIFEDKKNILNGFEKLIKKFKESIIVISYRSDGMPTIEEISKILKKYKKSVEIESIDYQYVLSKKQELKEVLIIGK